MIPRYQPANKEHHHVWAVCWVQRHGYCECSNILMVVPSRWVGQGRWQMVLFNFVNRPRKKLINKLINFFYFCTPFQLDHPKNDCITFPMHSPPPSNLLSCSSSITPACFWLVVVCKYCTGHIVLTFCNFFHCSVHHPKRWYGTPPTHSAQVASLLWNPPHCWCQLSVDCCILCPNSGHLRPRPHPSLCFSMGCILVPQTRDRRVARAPRCRAPCMVP